MTATDKPWVEPPPIDTEMIRRRHSNAKDCLAAMTIGWQPATPTKVSVEYALDDILMLVAAIERVRMTHEKAFLSVPNRTKGLDPVCTECVNVDGSPATWPCATIKAIDP